MRVNRLFVDESLRPGADVRLSEAAAMHLVRVLRGAVGDQCVLFNGDGIDYTARIIAIGKRDVRVEIIGANQPANESTLPITLLQSLARGEKMDLVLQKATELGVAGFVPVASERSEVRLDGDRVDRRVAHWRNVVIAACEQSGRASVPSVATPVALPQALQTLEPASTRLLLDPVATLAAADLDLDASRHVVLAIGPEGGWSPRDRSALVGAGFQGLRLGPRILRTETAGIAAIAALQALHGDFR